MMKLVIILYLLIIINGFKNLNFNRILHISALHSTNNYLSSYQWNIINKIKSNNKTTIQMNDYITKLIFSRYYYYTLKITNNFMIKYHSIVKNINKKELQQYAYIGLLHSINNYNGKTKFSIYSLIYINSYLYKGLTQLTPISLIPHHLKINKKWKNNNTLLYKKYNNINLLHDNDYLIERVTTSNKYINYDSTSNQQISNLLDNYYDKVAVQIFYSRYDINTFKKIRTFKILKQLYCYSYQTIRIKLNNVLEYLISNINYS